MPPQGRKRARRDGRTVLVRCLGAILLVVLLAQNAGLVRCPLNDVSADEKAASRREWAEEKAAFRREWAEEKAGLRREWEGEWAAHRAEIGDARRRWAAERAAHLAEVEQVRNRWAAERDAHRDEVEDARRRWGVEQEAHRAEVGTWTRERAEHVDEVAGWQRDRDGHARELEDWARQRAEEAAHRLELERRSQGVYWTEPLGDPNCHAYGTRTYYSWLRDLPGDLNWREVCFNMPPVVVHGRTFTTPDKCERNGKGETIGTWYVSGTEPGCTTHWGEISAKECVPGKPGFRRYEASIDGVPKGTDAQMMCATTPATVERVQFDSPTTCEWSGWTMMGIWHVPDSQCF
ncbi:hypothetical protein BC628DRAFT_1347478 [Trametes gibbosa]|nr:hypothetical protein BC628DRAFT_1347478 [Trametes gibbosa]